MVRWARPRRPRADALQLIVRDALHEADLGAVSCIPPDVLTPPLVTTWYVSTGGDVHTDASGLCASGIPPGDVSVTVVDKHGTEMTGSAIVSVLDVPTVTSYEVQDASSGTARDGQVRAHVARAPHSARYLWTTGVVTTEPTLRHAPRGTYAVACVSTDDAPIVFIHATTPARVGVTPRAELARRK